MKILCLSIRLCPFLILFVVNVFAQSPFWGFNYSGTLNFPVTSGYPTYSSTIPSHSPVSAKEMAAHTVYDTHGNLLFSVNHEKLYDELGRPVYSIQGPTRQLASEIEVFPAGDKCKKFYTVFWVYDYTYAPAKRFYLLLLHIDASTALSTSTSPIKDIDTLLSNGVYEGSYLQPSGGFGLVATSIAPDRTRSLYTVCGFDRGLPSDRYVLKRFTFNPDGSYSTGTGAADEIPLSKSNPDLIQYSLMEATPDGQYVAFPNWKGLVTVHTTTGIATLYPISNLAFINGIEYVPSLDRWYVSYVTNSPTGKAKGNIGYWENGAPSVLYSTGGIMLKSFGGSDLELGKDGMLYFADCPTCADSAIKLFEIYDIVPGKATAYQHPGNLYKFDPTVSPALFSKVNGIEVKQSYTFGKYYYLNNQIDGEDYGLWYPEESSISGMTINGSGLTPFTEAPQCDHQQIDACEGMLLTLDNPIPIGHEYKISWMETDSCGDTTGVATEMNYSDKEWIPGPFQSTDIRKYGNGSLSYSGPTPKRFLLIIESRRLCDTTIADREKALIETADWAPSFLGWKIETLAGFSSPSEHCSGAADIAGAQPYLKFNDGSARIDQFYLSVSDYGPAGSGVCDAPLSPVTTYTGAAMPNVLSERTLPYSRIDLANYLQEKCGVPAVAASAFFHPSEPHLFSINTAYYSHCDGLWTMTGNKYFTVSPGTARKLGAISDNSDIVVIPNPSSDFVTITIPEAAGKKCGVELLNSAGVQSVAMHAEQAIATGQVKLIIDVRQLPSGLYTCKATCGDRFFYTKISIVH